MTPLSAVLRQALREGEPVILVAVSRAQGSTPRDTDALMLVTREQSHGTIGGGQLEFHATDVARAMIAAGSTEETLDLPLGPHLGQCCGGRVELSLRRADDRLLTQLVALETKAEAARPQALLFGAGHVGIALAHALALLPIRTRLIDDRVTPPPPLPDAVAFEQIDDPEPLIAEAASGAAFVILTHSHALDYRLAAAALARRDAAYVGMIGSATKRARFERWFLARGGSPEALARFICPIGGKRIRDKRPEVIAALATAEIIGLLLSTGKADTEGVRIATVEGARLGEGARVLEGARLLDGARLLEGGKLGRPRSAA